MILFIYGAGGTGVEVYDLVTRNSKLNEKYSVIYFIDDFSDEKDYYGTRMFPFTSCNKYMKNETAEFIIAVGEPTARKMLFDKVKSEGYTFATLIDETSVVSDKAQISEGCIINAGVIVSSEAVIKENCFINFQSIIGHHAFVERNCVICPKAIVGGHDRVGEQTFLGMSASIMQEIDVGNRVIVGMGAMIFRDVEDNATVVGNPARVTKGNIKHKVFSSHN